MKALSQLLALTLLAASGLAVLPGASAEVPLPTDIPYCLAPECSSVTDDLLACTPVDRYDNGGTLHTTVGSDCHVRIDYKPYDCVWNCGWRTVVDTPYLTIRQYGQNGPESSAASAAALPIPPPCYSIAGPGCCGGPGFAPCPPPCDECQPAGPCPESAVATSQVFAYLGPHAGVALHGDCTADVWEAGLVCPKELPDEGRIQREAGPVGVSADTCVPPLECTCPPLMAPLASGPVSAAAVDLPDVCGPTALCQGPEVPDLPGPPTLQVCVTEPCDAVVCDEAEDRLVFHYEFTSECGVELLAEDVLACPHSWRDQQIDHSVGPVSSSIEACMPVTDCTCPPMMAADLGLPDLPGPPTFPVCVTQPCAYIVCDHARDQLVGGAVQYEFHSNCTVDVRDDVMCEASHYETVGAGPVRVGLEQCDPGNPVATSSSAALAPPIVCVMAPCGPQCLVPCFPQVVPSDCELRQATPDAVRTQVWGASPYDCTVDVEPAYMCVGGWGFDRHVTAAFIDVTARVCTGGPFPPAVVQAILDALALE